MSGAWLPVYEDLPRHPKTVYAALLLEVPEPQIVGHLVCLWLWAINNAPQGRVPQKFGVLERLVGWHGTRGALVDALKESGWLEENEGELVIHDWQDYAGRLLDKRAKDRARKDAWKTKNADGTRMERGRDAEETRKARVNSDSDSDSDKPIEELKLSSGEPDMAAEVFAYWQEVMGHPQAKLKGDRRQKIQSRLKEGYSAEQLKQAVDGCRASPHHRGENDTGTVYDSVGLIFRNAEKVEWFMALAQKGAPGQPRPDPQARQVRIERARSALEEGYEDLAKGFVNEDEWLEVCALDELACAIREKGVAL